MVTWHEETLCIEAGWLIGESKILSTSNYKALLRRGNAKQARRACNGRTALIEYASLPERYKAKIVERIGDPTQEVSYRNFRSLLVQDVEAGKFFAAYKLEGYKNLPTDKAKEYYENARFLNAIGQLIDNANMRRKVMNGKKAGIWDAVATVVANLKDEFGHNLPANPIRLKQRYETYKAEGYASLIHRSYGNQNSRKVSERLENLILSLFVMNNKPYPNMVLDLYLEFLAGKLDVYDIKTGEVFNRHDYYNDKGQPITISEATIYNYVNNPANKVIAGSLRNDRHTWDNIHRPHHHRHSPNYGLSKISLDDRDLSKMLDGKRAKAYYAYDVASGCIIGASYSKNKDNELFLDCLRDMFLFLHNNEFGFPLEMEVEHHIVSRFKDDLMKGGVVFPFVRFAAAGNSQEKRAEHFNRALKYGYEKRYMDGIGRWYLKNEANVTKQNLVWNADGTVTHKEALFTFERIVADNRYIINMYNNDLHPNQKKFPGMSRLDVLKATVNPNCVPYEAPLVARYVGMSTDTTIRRSQYCTVQYEKYQIENIKVLDKLQPNNYTVKAFYLPTAAEIQEVFLYQNENFIGKAERISKYNESAAEQTETDREVYQKQASFVSSFDKNVKDGRAKLAKIGVMPVETVAPDKVVIYESPKEPDAWANVESFEDIFEKDNAESL